MSDSDCSSGSQDDNYLSVGNIILSVIGILAGLVVCFAGYRLFRIMLFLSGFVLGAGVTYVCLHELTELPDWAAILIGVAAGVAAGAVVFLLWRVGMFLIGALGGLIIASAILSLQNGTLIEPIWARYLFVGGLMVVFGLLSQIFSKLIVVFCTAVAGSFGVIAGIDTLAQPHASFAFILPDLITGKMHCYDINWITYLLFGCWAVLALGGMIGQLFVTNGSYDHKKHHQGVIIVINNSKAEYVDI